MNTILVINTGSSSLKFSIFASDLKLIYRGEIENIFTAPELIISNSNREQILKETVKDVGYNPALLHLFNWLKNLPEKINLIGVGHRVVHGGAFFLEPVLITEEVFEKLTSLNSLAPLHQPYNLAVIKFMQSLYPELPQVACFDTSFHRTQEKLATLFAIPRQLTNEGIIRYGFHGISYEYIASALPEYIGEKATGKIIVAHLGHGASMCAINYGKSVATSMGFTALDGLMMGTRCGSIDPGVILYLLEHKKFSIDEVTTLLYEQSGLQGVSGISSDVRELQLSNDPNAKEAIDLFCYIAAKELAALCATLEGCDAIIFTAGIGEHSAIIRKKICDQLKWLGITFDESANENNATIISQKHSKILVAIIPTNEEYIIAKHTFVFC